MFRAARLVNVPEERTQVLSSGIELSELPDDSTNIFKKSNIDRYNDIPNALFSGGKNSVLDNFCHTEFTTYYTLDNKPDQKQINQGTS